MLDWLLPLARMHDSVAVLNLSVTRRSCLFWADHNGIKKCW